MSNIYIPPPLIVILMIAMDINTELHIPMREFEYRYTFFDMIGDQGCISCGILLSGTWARGVSSEHMEKMEMFSCSPT